MFSKESWNVGMVGRLEWSESWNVGMVGMGGKLECENVGMVGMVECWNGWKVGSSRWSLIPAHLSNVIL
jgi:hypothetical protein